MAAASARNNMLYCQEKTCLTGPINLAPVILPRFAIVMYKVNCVADIFFQQHCMAVAKMPMEVNTYTIP